MSGFMLFISRLNKACFIFNLCVCTFLTVCPFSFQLIEVQVTVFVIDSTFLSSFIIV